MFIQNDDRWKSFEMAPGVTIGEFGCFLTALCNILVLLGMDYTPLTLAQALQKNSGIDSEGNLTWIAFNSFGLFEKRYNPTDEINWSNSNQVWYIVQCFYKNTGHFCNLISVTNNIITYFDTYDGMKKQINLERVMSIREIIKN